MATASHPNGRAHGKTKQSKFFLVVASDLGDVIEDADKDQKRTALDRVEGVPGDEVLRALRKAFAKTYFPDDPLKPHKEAVEEIKQVAIEALLPLERLLQELKLAPVGSAASTRDHVRVFKFMIVPARELREKAKDEESGRVVPLGQLIVSAPADPLVRTLRQILALTFSEVYTKTDYKNLLAHVRLMTAQALLPVNWILEEIEVEPVAVPKVLGNEVYESAPETWHDDSSTSTGNQ